MLAEVPQDQRPRVYLARGPDGLETGLQGSINTEIIERVGAINVAMTRAARAAASPRCRSSRSWSGTPIP